MPPPRHAQSSTQREHHTQSGTNGGIPWVAIPHILATSRGTTSHIFFKHKPKLWSFGRFDHGRYNYLLTAAVVAVCIAAATSTCFAFSIRNKSVQTHVFENRILLHIRAYHYACIHHCYATSACRLCIDYIQQQCVCFRPIYFGDIRFPSRRDIKARHVTLQCI